MGGLFRTLRQLIREYTHFGENEINQLRREIEQQAAQLRELKAAREQRLQHEEQLMLVELRRTVQRMQAAEQIRSVQEGAVVESVDKLGDTLHRVMEANMQKKAAGILQSIDHNALLMGGTPVSTDDHVRSNKDASVPPKVEEG